MHWSYRQLMEMPAALYPELVTWLNEQHETHGATEEPDD